MNIEFTAFLYRPRELHERISDLAVDLIGSLAACTNTTAKYGATGGGSSGDDATSPTTAKLGYAVLGQMVLG